MVSTTSFYFLKFSKLNLLSKTRKKKREFFSQESFTKDRARHLKKKFEERRHLRRIKPFDFGIFFFSLLGITETLYLFVQKLKETPVFCVNQTCSIVLNSPFSEIFGIPLILFGLVSYIFIFVSIWKKQKGITFFNNPKELFYLLLITFGTFDLYFIFILEFFLKTSCVYCIWSIFFSGSGLFLKSLTQAGFRSIDLDSLIFIETFLILLAFINYSGNVVEMTNFLD
mmetsp:Transcript_28173/g.57152  ORF Transcript_28173/g.57152 Transcript_28173/m.57152 type:complete len:227 (+) Transcript_28173:2236-2916(+)